MPSPLDWSREQADTYMKSGGNEGTQLQGKGHPATTVGAKTGKLRKTPLMRVEHDEASTRSSPRWVGAEKSGLVPQRREEPTGRACDGTVTGDYDACEVFGDEYGARKRPFLR